MFVPVKCGLKSSIVWTIIHQHADSEVQLSSGCAMASSGGGFTA